MNHRAIKRRNSTQLPKFLFFLIILFCFVVVVVVSLCMYLIFASAQKVYGSEVKKKRGKLNFTQQEIVAKYSI